MLFLVHCMACIFLISKVSEGIPDIEQSSRCHLPADIIFLVDMSSSIYETDFNTHVKNFLKGMISSFNVGPDPNDTRFGVLLFSTDVHFGFHLNKHQTEKDILSAVDAIKYKGGDTNTHKALKSTYDWMLTRENGARSNVTKIVIVLTDGDSREKKKTIEAAQLVKSKGADIFSIGVGKKVSLKELEAIASSPSENFVFEVPNFITLDFIKNRLTKTTCSILNKSTTTSEPTTTTTITTTTNTTTTTTTTPRTPTPTTTTTTTTTPTTPTTTTTTPTATTIKPIEKVCKGKQADIYFVLDSSTSITNKNYVRQVVPFVRDLVSSFHISPKHTRVGLVTFSDNIQPVFSLSAFTDIGTLLKNLQPEHIPYLTGNTNTGDAIKYVSDNGLGPKQAREGVTRIIITITDGQSQRQQDTSRAAADAKEKGIIMFSIGVSKQANDKELRSISSDPDDEYTYHVDDFSALASIERRIKRSACHLMHYPNETFYQCSEIFTNIMFVYEYFNSVSLSKHILDDLVLKFTENAAKFSPSITIGTLTQPSIGSGVDPSGMSKLEDALTAISQGYSTKFSDLLKKLRLNVFNKAPSGSRKVAILVINNMTTDWSSIKTEVKMLKEMKVEIFLVVVENVLPKLFENLPSPPVKDHTVKVKTNSLLKDANINILNVVCGVNYQTRQKNNQVNQNKKLSKNVQKSL